MRLGHVHCLFAFLKENVEIDALKKQTSLCGFVLCHDRHTSLRITHEWALPRVRYNANNMPFKRPIPRMWATSQADCVRFRNRLPVETSRPHFSTASKIPRVPRCLQCIPLFSAPPLRPLRQWLQNIRVHGHSHVTVRAHMKRFQRGP